MRPETWYRGKPVGAQRFRVVNVRQLNAAYAEDTKNAWPEVALPVSGDATAILRGRTRW